MFLVDAVKGAASVGTGVVAAAGGVVVGGVVGTVTKGDPLGGMERGANSWGQTAHDVTAGACDGVGHLGRGVYLYSSAAISLPETAGAVLVRAPVRAIEAGVKGYFPDEVKGRPRHCAFLAACVYAEPRLRQAYWKLGNTEINLDPDVNLKSLALYLVNDSEMVLVFKGTSDKDDIAPDIIIAFGELAAVAKEKEDQLRRLIPGFHHSCLAAYLKARHRGRRLIVTGHSLGGAAAMTMAGLSPNADSVDYCYAFNPGTGTFHHALESVAHNHEMWRAGECVMAWCAGWEKKIEVHRIYGDPASALTSGSARSSVQTWRNTQLWAHGMENFLPDQWSKAANEQECEK